MKYAWANAKSYKEAKSVLVGVPDESGSHAGRKGASKGPDMLRKASRTEIFERRGKKTISQPQTGKLKGKLFDYGNVARKRVAGLAEKIVKDGKKPIFIGGDHSITFEVLKGLNKQKKEIKVIYFDAHPDFICSSHNYYGSVVCDASRLRNVNLRKSVEIGIRAPEKEELLNLKRKKIRVFHPIDIVEKGIANTFNQIKRIVGKGNIYLSIDLDVLDPAFAPGVDTPVPGGLTTNQLFYLTKKIAALGLIGFDVMELSPAYDIQERTSHLAAKLVIEVLASWR